MQRVLRPMETTLELVVDNKLDERELVNLAQDGSREAYDRLLQRHKAFVYSVCYRILGSSVDAVDITQSAFIQAYKSLKSFRKEASFRSWVCRIAINASTELVRREQRRLHI
ncbi:MAG TPA: RNA polymerase sigma factor [Armatimonadota bacterium]|jgi:RNA polymerase sigma-70 factor (ECF subfamily)|nr:RNA polymerase sigma factor [Armatimonadota bacterium]